ncbi:ornithine decarboxylase antizyme-domain-containing protein [Limtongia smithiae]|uniref:ornithine decarboxylase antizyme-domain-containing protein n=1 Tax=Limtongia smithiae TaxID=1125753 RepID=UPI0034CEA343
MCEAGRALASQSVKALMAIAYPQQHPDDRRCGNDDNLYIRLVDYDGHVWTGAVVDKTMLIYIEPSKKVKSTGEIKGGLMAVMDLATESLDCERMVICVDKDHAMLTQLLPFFSWVGFEFVQTPANFNNGQLSDAWIAMDIEL